MFIITVLAAKNGENLIFCDLASIPDRFTISPYKVMLLRIRNLNESATNNLRMVVDCGDKITHIKALTNLRQLVLL